MTKVDFPRLKVTKLPLKDNGTHWIEIEGEFDGNTCGAIKLITANCFVRERKTSLIIDFSKVELFSFDGLPEIIELKKKCEETGGQLALIPNKQVSRVIENAGMEPILNVFKNREEALAYL